VGVVVVNDLGSTDGELIDMKRDLHLLEPPDL
jgi:hypothetical protein